MGRIRLCPLVMGTCLCISPMGICQRSNSSLPPAPRHSILLARQDRPHQSAPANGHLHGSGQIPVLGAAMISSSIHLQFSVMGMSTEHLAARSPVSKLAADTLGLCQPEQDLGCK